MSGIWTSIRMTSKDSRQNASSASLPVPTTAIESPNRSSSRVATVMRGSVNWRGDGNGMAEDLQDSSQQTGGHNGFDHVARQTCPMFQVRCQKFHRAEHHDW